MKFNIDTYNGIVYEYGKDISKYKLEILRNWRRSNLLQFLKIGMDHVDTIQINPSGLNCFSRCDYCANDSSNYECSNVDFLSAHTLKNKINEIKSKLRLNRDPIEIVFSGGDFMLHPNLESLINVIFDEFNESINFGYCMSGLHDTNQVEKFLKILSNVDNNEKTFKSTIYFTCDLDGSNHRQSLVYKNINNDSSIELAHYFAKNILKLKKTKLVICTKITKDFDMNVNFTHYDQFLKKYDDKVFIRSGIVDGYYEGIIPTSDTVNKYFDHLLKKYNTYYQSRGAYTFFISDKNNDIFSNFGGYNLYLTELEKGVYANHPFDLPCWAYVRFIGIDFSGYFPCPFGFDHTNDIDKIIKPNYNEIEEINNWNYGECSECDIMPFCKLCKKNLCSKLPFRKTYMLNLINMIMNDSSHWCILPNIVKGDFLLK